MAKNRSASIEPLPEEKLLQDESFGTVQSENQPDTLQETEKSTITETSIPDTQLDQRNIAVAKEQLDVFESPRTGSRVMTQLKTGELVEILQVKSFGTVNWAYVSSSTRKVMGWIVADMLNMDVMLLPADDTDSTSSSSTT